MPRSNSSINDFVMEVNEEEVHVERNRSEDESSQGRSEGSRETPVRQLVPLQTLRDDYDERMEPLLAKLDSLSKEVKRLRKRRYTKSRSRSSESRRSCESRRRKSKERRHKENRKRKYRREDSSSEYSEQEEKFWNRKILVEMKDFSQ